MNVKGWLKHTYKDVAFGILIREPLMCKDGFVISIQASRSHYCVPRMTSRDGEYTHLELGFPSETEELIDRYRTGTIYPYVPIEIVNAVVKKHGGIAGGFDKQR